MTEADCNQNVIFLPPIFTSIVEEIEGLPVFSVIFVASEMACFVTILVPYRLDFDCKQAYMQSGYLNYSGMLGPRDEIWSQSPLWV